MKIKKSDIKLMCEIIMDYKNYAPDVEDISDNDTFLKNWMKKVDDLDSRLWKILNNEVE